MLSQSNKFKQLGYYLKILFLQNIAALAVSFSTYVWNIVYTEKLDMFEKNPKENIKSEIDCDLVLQWLKNIIF